MAVIAAASLSSAFAESCASSFSGFYAGVQAGINSTTGSSTISGYVDNINNAAGVTSSQKTSVGKKSFLGGIFAGYGMAVGSCAYVGAEVYGNFGNASETLFDSSTLAVQGNSFIVKMKRTYSFGAKVRLGYTVSQQAMIFLGLGLEYAKFNLQATNIYNQALTPQAGIDLVTKKNKGKISFAPSVGMDVFLNKNVFVRGEYTYVIGIKQKLNASYVNTALVTQTAAVKANMNQQRFTLGLGYKF